MALPIIHRGHEPETPLEKAMANKHVNPPTFDGENPDPVTPDVTFARNLLVGIDLVLPDGDKVPMWIIEDPDELDSTKSRTFPSKAIRVVEGEVVHVRAGNQGGPHTIHWHGIEPSPMNDGVGKTSFEVTGHFTYQWRATHAGTYFYHCHKNTPLHFEMGLYGLLIIDPPKPAGATEAGPPYPAGGPGYVAGFSPATNHVIRYDVEGFMVADEIDTSWHHLGHAAFLQKNDPDSPVDPNNFTHNGMLNNFMPDVFVINGAVRVDDATPITDPRVAVTAGAGQTILMRIANAGYTVQNFIFDIDVEVIAMDGRGLGVPPYGVYSHPFTVPANTPISLTSAQRWDLLIKPIQAGTINARVEFFDWVNGTKYATARSRINVT